MRRSNRNNKENARSSDRLTQAMQKLSIAEKKAAILDLDRLAGANQEPMTDQVTSQVFNQSSLFSVSRAAAPIRRQRLSGVSDGIMADALENSEDPISGDQHAELGF